MNFFKLTLIISFTAFCLSSCDSNKPILTDTPISGTINVMADESYKPLLDSEKMVFESTYSQAKINIIYKPSNEVMNSFDNDSIRLFITAMAYDSSFLKNYFQLHSYYPTVSILAKDAVAIIANNNHKGLKISLPELAKICDGSITDFSQLKHKVKSGKITLVFDNTQSSTLAYIQDSVLKGKAITSQAFAQNTNEEVMKYVESNPNALGIIGVNWISDSKDESTIEFSKHLFPVNMASSDTSIYYYSPHPSYIAMHKYPMRRYMQATLKEGGAALGRGFVNFISGDIGQRIVLKSGLVPAKVVTRIVEVKSEF